MITRKRFSVATAAAGSAALGLFCAAVPLYLGYVYGKYTVVGKPHDSVDCRAPQDETQRTIATLRRDSEGVLVLQCHYATMLGYGKGPGDAVIPNKYRNRR